MGDNTSAPKTKSSSSGQVLNLEIGLRLLRRESVNCLKIKCYLRRPGLAWRSKHGCRALPAVTVRADGRVAVRPRSVV